jgi:hypothetical protein
MVVFIEPLGKPFAHLSVVKSMLFAELNDDLNSNEILFISSLDYFNSIPENFRNKLKFKEIKVSESSILNIFEIVFIVISAFFNNWKIKNIKVYLLFSKSYSNIILKFLSFFFLCKKKRLYVLLHGELQNVTLKGSRSILLDGRAQRMLYWLDTKFSSNLKFVIISEFVFEKLKKSLGYDPLNFVSIDLPYLYDDKKESTKQNTNELVVSTVGVNSRNKKSFLLNNIASNFEDKIKSGALLICISGRNDDVLFSELIDTPNMGSRYLLSTEEYAKRINSSDVLVFFNDDNYSLISSGSYFDCINFEKPILAMKNEQWEYNFKQFGDIGYLCNNIDEMYGHINSLLNNNEYLNVFSRNLEIARDNSSIEKCIPYFMSKFQ